MDNRQKAQQIYDQMTPAREQWQRMGTVPSDAMAATVEEIEAHLDLVEDVSAEFGFRLDASKIEFGASREEIVAIAEGKAKRYRRRAGIRALQQKYGHDAAKRIVRKHSGRTIRD